MKAASEGRFSEERPFKVTMYYHYIIGPTNSVKISKGNFDNSRL
jgi:hypothetical protein